MKRALLALLFTGLVAGGCLLAARAGFFPRGTPLDYFFPKADYARSWKQRINDCRCAGEAEKLASTNKEGGSSIILNDGTWVTVVMEHACCTGAGYNATLYVTSSGEAWLDADSCYCGFLPLAEELARHSRTNAAAFLAGVRSQGKTLNPL